MNYEKLYFDIINHRASNPSDGYTERHHIIPKSLGGTDDAENIVSLTAREHFLCHWLLVKMYKNYPKKLHKMVKAFNMMCLSKSNNQDRKVNSKIFEKYRHLLSEAQKKSQTGQSNSQFDTRWVFNDTLKQSKKISKCSALEPGWQEGRKIKFEEVFLKIAKEVPCNICNRLVLAKITSITCKSCISKKNQGKACVVMGIQYDAVSTAAKALGKNDETIRRWITDKRNNSYYL
jgi:hypothetical protein